MALTFKDLPAILDRLEMDPHVIAYNLGVEVLKLTDEREKDRANIARLEAEIERLTVPAVEPLAPARESRRKVK